MKDKKDKPFEDPHDKISKIIDEKPTTRLDESYKSKRVEQVYDNLKFAKQVRENPITIDKYKEKILGYNLNLEPFIEMRVWPRSIYVTDKLLRLVASARLEFLKRYLVKKRKMDLDLKWLIILFLGIGIAVFVILFIIPMLQGGGPM